MTLLQSPQVLKREYCEQLCANKFNNLDEMDKFLEWHKLPKLTQEEICNLNCPVSIEELQSVV